MDIQDVNTTYEPFSLEPEYIEANRGFVNRWDLSGVNRFLDLACGTGTVSELLLTKAPRAHLNGIDYDPVQIGLISKRFAEQGYTVREGTELTDDYDADGKPVLVFGQGSADTLPFPDASFDCVTIANAIHLLPDKHKLLVEIRRVLKPGGCFGFNSAFYSGTITEGTDRVYMDWLQLATRYIEEKNQERKAEGLEPYRRKRGTGHKAFQNRWYSPSEWAELLAGAGLALRDENERFVDLNERCFALVGAYGGLAEVLLSGFPVDIASEALQAAAPAAMKQNQLASVPRNYLEMWATAS